VEFIQGWDKILILALENTPEQDALVESVTKSNDEGDSNASLPNWDELDNYHKRNLQTLAHRAISESQHHVPSNTPISKTPAALLKADTAVHVTSESDISNTPATTIMLKQASDCSVSPQQNSRQGLDYVQHLLPEQQEQYALPQSFLVEGVSLYMQL
jgi:hypothetical protein